VDLSQLKPAKEFKKEVIRVLLAVIFFFFVYLILVALATSLAAGVSYLGIRLIIFKPATFTLLIGIGMIGMGVFVLFFLIKFIFSIKRIDHSGFVEIKKADHPELYSFLQLLSNETKTRLPKRIYLAPDVLEMIRQNRLQKVKFWSWKNNNLKMNKVIFIFLFSLSSSIHAQDPRIDSILKEGILLYRLERASWIATDEYISLFPNMTDSIGGYLSYQNENGNINTIFFGRSDPNHILVRYQYDSLPKQESIFADVLNPTATSLERELIKMRQDALFRCSFNKDNFFKFYENTSFNLIPLIRNKERKVYILTASKKSDIIIIGNDYLIDYDENGNFISQRKIHNSLISLPLNLPKDSPAVATVHTHVLSDFIDPTDICTLLLYKQFIQWKTHYVMSGDNVSVFDLENESLEVMKKSEWQNLINNKINKVPK
jgi:hypothetical protein